METKVNWQQFWYTKYETFWSRYYNYFLRQLDYHEGHAIKRRIVYWNMIYYERPEH